MGIQTLDIDPKMLNQNYDHQNTQHYQPNSKSSKYWQSAYLADQFLDPRSNVNPCVYNDGKKCQQLPKISSFEQDQTPNKRDPRYFLTPALLQEAFLWLLQPGAQHLEAYQLQQYFPDSQKLEALQWSQQCCSSLYTKPQNSYTIVKVIKTRIFLSPAPQDAQWQSKTHELAQLPLNARYWSGYLVQRYLVPTPYCTQPKKTLLSLWTYFQRLF